MARSARESSYFSAVGKRLKNVTKGRKSGLPFMCL